MSQGNSNPNKPSRRKFLKRALLASTIGAGAYVYGIEPRWISVERRTLTIPRLPNHLVGKTAVQISDLHVGARVDDRYLRSQFDYVNSLSPAFVFFTGDYLDRPTSWHLKKGKTLLQDFPRGKIGTACVLGNHDYGCGRKQVKKYAVETRKLIELFQDSDLNLLLDQTVELGGLHVAGLRDWWHGGFDNESAALTIERIAGKPALTLSHNPDTVDLPIWDRYDSWVLSGHTHGGQCTFPIIGAPILPVRNRRYVAGAFDIEGGHKLYINRGIGHTHRLRFMARPEITIFDLQRSLMDV